MATKDLVLYQDKDKDQPYNQTFPGHRTIQARKDKPFYSVTKPENLENRSGRIYGSTDKPSYSLVQLEKKDELLKWFNKREHQELDTNVSNSLVENRDDKVYGGNSGKQHFVINDNTENPYREGKYNGNSYSQGSRDVYSQDSRQIYSQSSYSQNATIRIS